MEQRVDGIRLDEIAIEHSEDRRSIFIGDEELLYRKNSFYFYPTITFYEEDRKYLGAYLYPDHEEILKTIPRFRAQVVRRNDFLCRYHLGGHERVPDTIRRLGEARLGLKLGTQAISFDILDQFMESDNRNFIIAIQARVLQIHVTDDMIPSEET